ncbi:SEC14-like protein 2 [Ixodes scapularis]|uniref:SEC14-like protein 2 n=1 Tax=Ixodes scapularis TaxID=6945 RepID=UPI001C37E8B6|nr:SEC14-like protein 2 [Ixodes scapularis]
MSGFLEDLSYKQNQALDDFKRRIQDIWKEEFTDSFLLRWLRAREFDVNKAENMLRKNQAWRIDNGIDLLLQTYQWPPVLKRYMPGGLCSHDRDCRPLWIMRTGNADYKGMLQCVSKEDMLKACFYQLELILADLKSQSFKHNKNVKTFTVLCDCENFSLKQIYSVNVIEFLREIIVKFEENYPETLERCLVINAPSFFPLFWKIIRPFVSEKTATKMEIFSQVGWQPVLFKYVEPSELPAYWGGKLFGPNNDPECSHEIGRGGQVPEELYLRNGPRVSDDRDSTTCSLERGQSLEVPVEVTRAGSTLRWKFQTSPGHDVDFSITRSVRGDAKQGEQVRQVARIKCDLVPETGQLENLAIGSYIFKFDNSYSWFAKKQLSYILQVGDPENSLVPRS